MVYGVGTIDETCTKVLVVVLKSDDCVCIVRLMYGEVEIGPKEEENVGEIRAE